MRYGNGAYTRTSVLAQREATGHYTYYELAVYSGNDVLLAGQDTLLVDEIRSTLALAGGIVGNWQVGGNFSIRERFHANYRSRTSLKDEWASQLQATWVDGQINELEYAESHDTLWSQHRAWSLSQRLEFVLGEHWLKGVGFRLWQQADWDQQLSLSLGLGLRYGQDK